MALVGIAAARWGGFAAADALAAGAVAVMLGATGLSVATEAPRQRPTAGICDST